MFSCLQSFRVSVPAAVMPTLFFLRQMDMGSLTCARFLGACRTRKGHEQVYTRVDSEGYKQLFITLPRQGIEPRIS